MKIYASGISMLPTYKEGDLLDVDIFNNVPEIGETIVYSGSRNDYIAHRVMFCLNDILICKGDNFRYYDPPVNRNDIIGVVRESNKQYDNVKIQMVDLNIYQQAKMFEQRVLITSLKKLQVDYNKTILEQPVNSLLSTVYVLDDSDKKLKSILSRYSFNSVYFV